MSDLKTGLEDEAGTQSVFVDEDVIEYISERNTDFRISTSCGGPVLLPISYKPPKPTDVVVKAGGRIIYISTYQVRYITHIHMGLIPYHLFNRGTIHGDYLGF